MWKCFFLFCIAAVATLGAETRVLAFAGSTRTDSVNRKLVAQAAEIAHKLGAHVTLINLKEYPLPFYDADREAKEGMPESALSFSKLIAESQIILIASPEYNASVTGVLKNAIDWISRTPSGAPARDVLKGKICVLMSASPGAGGGARGLIHLRTILESIGATVLPEHIILGNAYSAFDEAGQLKDSTIQSKLEKVVRRALSKP